MNKRKEVMPNNLKEYRLKAGLTQKQVATLLGVNCEKRICHWEKGKNIPNLINPLKLSILYKATPVHLYSKLMLAINDEVEARIAQQIA